jgi:cell division protein ZapC
MLSPSERWYWTYCSNTDRLLLEISENARYCAPFAGRNLVHQPKMQPFSMAEAEAYWLITESLQQLDLADAERLEICLAGLSAAYLQQQAHKSWYFQQGTVCDTGQFDLVQLRGLSSQTALVLSVETDSVTCLLLGEISTLAGKQLPRFQVIRVLRNRISKLSLAASYRHRA